MIKTTKNNACIYNMRLQQGVHIHLFGINNNGNIISTLILTRSDNGLRGIISGKVEVGETTSEAAKRELYEETGLQTIRLYHTGIRLNIPCRKYQFEVQVFTGIIAHGREVRLNDENSMYQYVETHKAFSCMEVGEQKKCYHECRSIAQKISAPEKYLIPEMELG